MVDFSLNLNNTSLKTDTLLFAIPLESLSKPGKMDKIPNLAVQFEKFYCESKMFKLEANNT